MQEEKSKLKGFTSAVMAAAEQRAAKLNEETDRLEREAMEHYSADLAAAAAKRRAAALAAGVHLAGRGAGGSGVHQRPA